MTNLKECCAGKSVAPERASRRKERCAGKSAAGLVTSYVSTDRRFFRLSLIEILTGNVIFRHFVGLDFLFVTNVFHAQDDIGLEGVAFFEQFIHAF